MHTTDLSAVLATGEMNKPGVRACQSALNIAAADRKTPDSQIQRRQDVAI
ncbi:MAG: hypothetical protein KDJ22_11570 [Candidatus Competibacteraceae bacterium]|nr:hypothetical protein [Candidatus Competibacteraceae bacterium]MCP5126613.1 hypothetical protein [Gammaproteobacteria bacterium]HRX71882.1 hypothetical protein [Candidatus Competibacteraceae bacterium]